MADIAELVAKVRLDADQFAAEQQSVLRQADRLAERFQYLQFSSTAYAKELNLTTSTLSFFTQSSVRLRKELDSLQRKFSNVKSAAADLSQTEIGKGVQAGIKNLTNELNKAQQNINGFAKTTNSSLASINVGSSIKAQVTDIKKGVESARIEIEKFQHSTAALKSSFSSISKYVLAAFGLNEIKGMIDAYTTLNNRLKLVTNSEKELKTVRAAIAQISSATGQNLDATAAIYQRLAQSSEQTGLSGQKLLTVTEAISKAMVIGGGSAQSQEAALIQLGQAFASGTLRGEELNSVLEQAPGLANAIAKGMGVSVGALRTLAATGKLTSKVVADSLLKQAPQIEADYLKTTRTIDQSFQNLKTQLTMFVGGANESSGAAKALSAILQTVANNINLIATAVMAFMGFKLAAYFIAATTEAVAFTAALIAQGSAAIAAARANGIYAVSLGAIKGSTIVSTLSKITSVFTALKTSMAALAATKFGTLIASVSAAIAPFLAIASAAYAAYTAIKSIFDFFNGDDPSNAISNTFDNILRKIGLLKDETETLGTKLYDLTHNDYGEFTIKGLFVFGKKEEDKEKPKSEDKKTDPTPAVLSKEAIDFKTNLEKAAESAQKLVNNFGKTQEQLAAENAKNLLEQLKIKTQDQKTIEDATKKYQDVINNLNKLEVNKLSDSINQAHDSIAETVKNFGKSSSEIALSKQHIALETMARKGATREQLAAAQAQINDTQKLYAHSQALETEKKNREENSNYIKDLQTKAAELKAELTGGQNGLIAYKLSLTNATAEQIKLAQAANAVTESYQRQKEVMGTLESLKDQVAKLGLSDKQKQLYDLQKKGATQDQLNQARQYLDQIDKFGRAQELTKKAAEKLSSAATSLTESANLNNAKLTENSTSSKRNSYWEEWKKRFGSESSMLGYFKGSKVQELNVSSINLPNNLNLPESLKSGSKLADNIKNINSLNVDKVNVNGSIAGNQIFDKALQPQQQTDSKGKTETLKIDFSYNGKNVVGEFLTNPEFKKAFINFFAGIVSDIRKNIA